MKEKIRSKEAQKKYDEMAKVIGVATKVVMKINEIETGIASSIPRLKYKKP